MSSQRTSRLFHNTGAKRCFFYPQRTQDVALEVLHHPVFYLSPSQGLEVKHMSLGTLYFHSQCPVGMNLGP